MLTNFSGFITSQQIWKHCPAEPNFALLFHQRVRCWMSFVMHCSNMCYSIVSQCILFIVSCSISAFKYAHNVLSAFWFSPQVYLYIFLCQNIHDILLHLFDSELNFICCCYGTNCTLLCVLLAWTTIVTQMVFSSVLWVCLDGNVRRRVFNRSRISECML